MQEIQLSISAQIKAQVKNATKEGLPQQPATINQKDIKTKLDVDHERITQESKKKNKRGHHRYGPRSRTSKETGRLSHQGHRQNNRNCANLLI